MKNLTRKTYTRLLADASPEAASDDRVIRFTFSTDQIALDGHRILPGAWQSTGYDGLREFRANPVFLWQHLQDQPPVGRVISIQERGGKLVGAVKFADHDFADTIYRLFKENFLRGASVSWVPVEWSYSKDKNREPGSIDFKKVRLLEISAVTVPCDSAALADARSAGVNLEPVASWARSASTSGASAMQRDAAKAVERALAKPIVVDANELRKREERRRRAHALLHGDHFKNLGEWAQAVTRFYGGDRDPRLSRAATGAGETKPSDGGFLVPEAFAAEILGTVYADRTSILPYVRRFNITDGANTLNVSGVDETSRANGYRWGGVVADFVDEGAPEAPTFPKLKQTGFAAEKIMGFVVVSAELFADAQNLGEFLKAAFVDELTYKLEQYVLSSAGTGAGRPLSIAKSPALVIVAAVAGQPAGSVVAQNLRAMWRALPSASRRRAIWCMDESAIQTVESIGEISFAQSGSANPDDLPRVIGRPVIETDVMPKVGAVGDILLIDPAWYGVASKPMAWALSADVMFVNDQVVFRLTWRVDARPLVSAPISASDGDTRSAFVALAAR
jgi:HK97 family phage major capsid protein/HK97 family phage prohead protease